MILFLTAATTRHHAGCVQNSNQDMNRLTAIKVSSNRSLFASKHKIVRRYVVNPKPFLWCVDERSGSEEPHNYGTLRNQQTDAGWRSGDTMAGWRTRGIIEQIDSSPCKLHPANTPKTCFLLSRGLPSERTRHGKGRPTLLIYIHVIQ